MYEAWSESLVHGKNQQREYTTTSKAEESCCSACHRTIYEEHRCCLLRPLSIRLLKPSSDRPSSLHGPPPGERCRDTTGSVRRRR